MVRPVNGNKQTTTTPPLTTTAAESTTTTAPNITTAATSKTLTYNPANNPNMMGSIYGTGYGSAMNQGGLPNMATGVSDSTPYMNLDFENSIYAPSSGSRIAGFSMGAAAMFGGLFGGAAMAGMEAPSFLFADDFVANCIGLYLGKGNGTDKGTGTSDAGSVNIPPVTQPSIEDSTSKKDKEPTTEERKRADYAKKWKEGMELPIGEDGKSYDPSTHNADGTPKIVKSDTGANTDTEALPADKKDVNEKENTDFNMLKTLADGETALIKGKDGAAATKEFADAERHFINKDDKQTNEIKEGKLTVDGNNSSNVNTFMAFGLTNNTKATMTLKKDNIVGVANDFFKYEKDAKLGNADGTYDETEFIKAFEAYAQNLKDYTPEPTDERKGKGVELSKYDTGYLKTLFKAMAGKDGKLEKSEFEDFIKGLLDGKQQVNRVQLDNYGNKKLES